MKRHPDIAARILDGIRHLDDVAVGIRTHHERPDGRGYPQGLTGDEIPVEGRIVGLADSLDAMTSDRTYRNALALDAAVEEIRNCSGTQFDPELVETLLSWDLESCLAQWRRDADTALRIGQQQEASPS